MASLKLEPLHWSCRAAPWPFQPQAAHGRSPFCLAPLGVAPASESARPTRSIHKQSQRIKVAVAGGRPPVTEDTAAALGAGGDNISSTVESDCITFIINFSINSPRYRTQHGNAQPSIASVRTFSPKHCKFSPARRRDIGT
jgi:hypothetical protein